MIGLLEKIFYMAYLRVKYSSNRRPEDQIEFFVLATVLLGMSLIGYLFFTAVFLFVGMALEVRMMALLLGRIYSIGIPPMLFLGPLASFFIFYFLCIRNGRYLDFSNKYPDLTMKNIRRLDQNYLLIPVVASTLIFMFSFYVTFKYGLGV